MIVRNVHSREYRTSAERLGSLLETLAGPDDRLWPHDTWAPMVLSNRLQVASAGGHGPIRYLVEAHEAGKMVRFRFTGPPGFDGTHTFTVEPAPNDGSRLTHLIDMQAHGPARLSWPLLFRPMHDALLEEALDRVAQELDPMANRHGTYSWYVRFLRRLLAFLLRRKKRG